MVTCYEEKLPDWYANCPDSRPTLDGNTYPGLSEWQLRMLMKWAKNDPVSDKETNRNNAVYGIQQNRNPFIDYPGLEEYIWGDKKNVAFSYDNYATGIQDCLASGLQKGRQDGRIYGANGQLHRTYQRGLNIEKRKNGRTRKVIKR
jgi:hypothetical protein